MSYCTLSIIVDVLALLIAAAAVFRVERSRRRRAVPPRSVRMIVEIDGRTFIDIDSKLALSIVDCAFGQPVVNDYAVHGVQLRLTLQEGGTPA